MTPSAIVTGSDSGIGRATATVLARQGFDIGITWHRDEGGARRTAAEVEAIGRWAEVRSLDLEDGPGAASTITELADALGGLDVLVNNGAVNHRALVLEEEHDAWQRVLAVDLTGPFMCSQAAARTMVAAGRGGRIVNITSVLAHAPLRGGGGYCAAKAGLGALTKVMALELAEYGITVNAVAPGHVATPMNDYADDADVSLVDLPPVPVRRPGASHEVAAAVAFLASPEAAYVTGASLLVDGGLLLTPIVALQEAVETSRAVHREHHGDG